MEIRKGKYMKAYLVYDNYADESATVAVFAESVNEAKSLAMGSCDLELADYVDLRARRKKELDGYYDGTKVWEWNDMEHRKILVKVCDFACLEPDMCECQTCVAKEYCGEYEYLLENEEY